MTFRLSPEAETAGYGLLTFDTVGSTSAAALDQARAGESGPLWIATNHQSAGSGRRGSAWQTPRGNLAASLLLTLDLPPATLAQLGFVAGVALVRALEKLCRDASVKAGLRTARQDQVLGPGEISSAPPAEVRGSASLGTCPSFELKWPNDVLAGGAKLAGILLQTELLPCLADRGRRAVAIGLGVNVAHAPADLPYPAASLGALGTEGDAAALFTGLSAAWCDAFALWDRGRGFEAIRRAWLARAAGRGSLVAVRAGERLLRGVFDTIDHEGRLVISEAGGARRSVSAGEVYFGAAATARSEAFA